MFAILTAAGLWLASGVATLPQYNWGMTPAKVAAASKGAAPLGDKPMWRKSPYTIGNFGTATIAGLTFEAAFYYEGDALGHIRTYRAAPCPEMKAFLSGKYGTPATESAYSSSYYGTWNHAASKTQIDLAASSGECRVILTRLAS